MASSSGYSRPTVPPSPEAFEAPLGDAALLERFIHNDDQAAFEVLLGRHGGMVMGLLRRLSLQEADAEDAFQATFLTLVRKAGSIGKRDALASWLYKVAFRIALDVRERAKKRQTKEQALTGSEPAPMEKDVAAFWSLLDAEALRLPEKYRVPFVLCHLQGQSLEQAAAQLGCPVGTVGTRLARAREFLRTRLARRGLVLTAAAVASYLGAGQAAQAAVAPATLHGTLQLVLNFRKGAPAAASAAAVFALSDRAVQALLLAKAKFAGLVAASVLIVAVTSALLLAPLFAQPSPEPAPQKDWMYLWGTVVDPDKDGRFVATRETLTVTVPGPAHVLVDGARQNAPRVIRDVRGDFQVQVKVAALAGHKGAFQRNLFLEGPAGFLNTSAFHGAGLVVMEDADNFFKLEQGVTGDEQKHYLAWQTRIEGVSDHGSLMHPKNVRFNYLRIQRLGPHLWFAGSPDGERWKYFPIITAEDLPDRFTVGLIAGHNTDAGMEATFAEYQVQRFHFGNNPRPAKKGGVALPPGCARCH